MGYPMVASGAIYALYLKFLTQRNLVAEFHPEKLVFCATLFGGLGVTYAIHL